MASEPARLPPFEVLRNELAHFRGTYLVMASGKGPLLDMIDAYLVATESRLAALELKSAEAKK